MIEFIKLYFYNEAGGLNIQGKIFYTFVYLIIALILTRLVSFVANKLVKSRLTKLRTVDSKRLKSVASILKSFLNAVIIFTWALSVLKMFGVNTSAIITTAGIGGIAISFGAKSLVEDVISGIFLMLEDSFVIGDYITVAGKDGEVERMGLRTTTIRDFNGELHVIPNGEIRVVTNRNKNIQRAILNLPLSYDDDYNLALEILKREFEKINDDHAVIEPINVIGITDFKTEGVVITALGKTIPGEQWRIERMMRKIAIDELSKAGIGIIHNSLDVRIDK